MLSNAQTKRHPRKSKTGSGFGEDESELATVADIKPTITNTISQNPVFNHI
jgi:hypothetical protein